MVRSKPGPKKQKRGVDFKKIKRKIGRKLPPPKNATNTEIKSKAIILPEQSVASERSGLAVSKKGLTLRELLQQTSHHNAKIRKAALAGVKDLLLKHPAELKLHKLAVVERLRERICDTDRVVRDTLYSLFEHEIFPCLKEEATGPIVSLLMAYVFNAMTHMAIDIRLMAFKFFNLIVQSFPSSFILYAEKILDSYLDILKNNHIYLQDKSKLRNVLDGLLCCMSSLVSKKEEANPSNDPNIVEQRRLHAFGTTIHKDDAGITSIAKKLDDLVPILVNCFRESTSLIRAAPVVDAHSFDCMLKTVHCINVVVEVFLDGNHLTHASYGLLPASTFVGPNGRSTMLVHLSKLWELFPIDKMQASTDKEEERYFILNVKVIEIFLHLMEWIDYRTIPIERFLEFISSIFESLLPSQAGRYLVSNKVLLEKHSGLIVQFFPRLVSQITGDWKIRLLEAFTDAFKYCKVESKLCQAYLSAIEEMLLPVTSGTVLFIAPTYPDMVGYQVAWVQHLPYMLVHLGDKHLSVLKVILKLILRIGQWCSQNSPIALEFDNLQLSLKGFYGGDRGGQYGSFIKLPGDCQELAVCILFYMSSLSSDFLEALSRCCLCDDMVPLMLLRIVEVLHSAYKAGHVDISDYVGFLVTLVAHKLFPEKFCNTESDGQVSNRGILKSLNAAVCSCLSQMGDNSLVLKLLCSSIFHEMSKNLALDNMYGLLRMIVTLDTRPTKLSEENLVNLSDCVYLYLIKAASYLPEQIGTVIQSAQIRLFGYYIQPCLFLFSGSNRLLFHVLKMFDSSIMEDLSLHSSSGLEHILRPFPRVHVICSVLIFLHDDVRVHRSLSLCKEAIRSILQNVLSILDSNKYSLTLEEKDSLQALFNQLKSRSCKLQYSGASDLKTS